MEQMNTPTWIDFGTNLVAFWEGFGSQVGTKFVSKVDAQRYRKNDHFLEMSTDSAVVESRHMHALVNEMTWMLQMESIQFFSEAHIHI